jgi:hypothetical protein
MHVAALLFLGVARTNVGGTGLDGFYCLKAMFPATEPKK